MSTLKGINLHKQYGSREVVCGVSPIVNQGEIVGFLGPNGAGKTTSFYMLTGIIKPTSGTVLMDKLDISSWPLHERARIGISYLPQESSVFRRLTVRQNIQIIMEYTDFSHKEQKKRTDALLDEFGLSRLEKSLASYLSGGERRRLEIARALIRDPKFILLDEPFAGIDPIAVGDIKALVRDLKNRGIGVLISDHNARETLTICDRADMMCQGAVFYSGTPEQIASNPQVKEVYLGEDFTL